MSNKVQEDQELVMRIDVVLSCVSEPRNIGCLRICVIELNVVLKARPGRILDLCMKMRFQAEYG